MNKLEWLEPFVNRDEHGTPDERWRPESEFVAIVEAAMPRCSTCRHNRTIRCPMRHAEDFDTGFVDLNKDDDYCSKWEEAK